MHVLLVSTDPDLTLLVRTALLGVPDADVSLVATPQRALQQLEEAGPFALVVADNDTHPAGGLSLAREVKARARMAAPEPSAAPQMPPVVLLVAREQDRWLAGWAEADAYVVKPVDPFDLAEVARALVDGQPVPALPGVGGRGVGLREVRAGHLQPVTAGDLPAGEAEEVP